MNAETIIIIIISVLNGVLLGFQAGRDYEYKKTISFIHRFADDSDPDDYEPEPEI